MVRIAVPIGQIITPRWWNHNMPGLSDYLTDALRLAVRHNDPCGGIWVLGLQPPSDADEAPSTTVAGLGLINPKRGFLAMINLLSPGNKKNYGYAGKVLCCVKPNCLCCCLRWAGLSQHTDCSTFNNQTTSTPQTVVKSDSSLQRKLCQLFYKTNCRLVRGAFN